MEIKFDKIVIALAILIALIAIGQGLWLYSNRQVESPETPTIVMSVERTGNLNYTFTVAQVTSNDVLWGDVMVDVDPDPISIIAPSDTDYVSSGDKLVIVFSGEVETEVKLINELYGGLLSYHLIFTPLD
jgi:hypothetical protein